MTDMTTTNNDKLLADLKQLKNLEPVGEDLAAGGYWSPSSPGEFIDAIYRGIDTKWVVDPDTKTGKEIACVQFDQLGDTEDIEHVYNGSVTLVGIFERIEQEGKGSPGQPFRIAFKGREATANNKSAAKWNVTRLG